MGNVSWLWGGAILSAARYGPGHPARGPWSCWGIVFVAVCTKFFGSWLKGTKGLARSLRSKN